jgi:transcriptional regulator with XRE-family HTH domain
MAVTTVPDGPELQQVVAERFAENLRVERARARLTQEDLAFRADVHRTQISLMEGGQRLPRLITLVKLGGALGVGIEVFAKGISYEPTVFTRGGFVIENDGRESD